ncbi:MAG: YjbH domain-containing protein [Ketobacteraceae bacterium]|nr:YjbH domain-containing protein [Ketobacteraceae bacterium]
MIKTRSAVLVFTLNPVAAGIAMAADDSLSLNGFTGLFTVPNGHVTEYGTGVASYADMMFFRNQYVHNNNVMGSFGVFPHVEISGRIAWFNTHSNLFEEEGEPRDLSANIKINIPYIPNNWFQLAIGKQDIGGEADFFSTKYIAASKTLGPFRFDIGYGSNSANDRLDGEFGGVEFAPFDWISIIAEYDAQDVNSGFRLSTPENWLPEGFRVDLTVLADTSHENSAGRSFYGINVKFPLGGGFTGKRPDQPARQPLASVAPRKDQKRMVLAQSRIIKRLPQRQETTTDLAPQAVTHSSQPGMPNNPSKLANIQSKIESLGFDRVSVGTRQNQLVVAFENNIYNRSELDAIGVVLAWIAREASDYPRATLVLKNQGIPVISVETNPSRYYEFLKNNEPAPIYAYYPSSSDMDAVNWYSDKSQGFIPKPRITISPVLNSGIATEYGVWDYSFGAAINGAIHLWPGAIASATYTQELDSSEDFDEDGPFRGARIKNDIKEMTIQQGLKFGSLIYNNLHLGKIRYDYSGFQNQTLFHDPSGQHQLSFRFGDYEHEDTAETKDFQLLSYRYYWPAYDVAITTTAGEFWDGDKGYRVNTLFRFGDQTVELFYKDVEAPITEEQTEFIGIAWTLPLTPQRDWDSDYLQVKGNEAWRWGMQTRINNDRNTVSFGAADIAIPEWTLERSYLNNDKLSPEYLYRNIDRIRKSGL